MDSKGIVCIVEHIRNAALSIVVKHQVIMPKGHHVELSMHNIARNARWLEALRKGARLNRNKADILSCECPKCRRISAQQLLLLQACTV